MINTLRIVLLTVLTFGNLFLLGVSVHYWKTNKSTTSRVGFAYLALLTISNMIATIGGALW